MAIKDAYAQAIQLQKLVNDEKQQCVVDKLEKLQKDLLIRGKPSTRLKKTFRLNTNQSESRGIYLWGGVGRGKTLLMDLFFSSLDIKTKRRTHFHRMMSHVHQRLNCIRGTEDPLDTVAAEIASDVSVLCFDEFYVSDIGDAMILGKLLDGLFSRGITLVATSNTHPNDLYKDGLQRQQFLPAIQSLQTHTEVINLDSGIDYRLRLFQAGGTYFISADEEVEKKLLSYVQEIATGEILKGKGIQILGREIKSRYYAKGVIWFSFSEICDGPRNQEDYIEISRYFHTVVISKVPTFTPDDDNAARRFISLVDEFYDRKVKLVISAEIGVTQLYQGKHLKFQFQRTSSRLTEMQTTEYLTTPHQG